MHYSLYLDIYIGFLTLISIVLLANTLLPKKKDVYSIKKDYQPRVLVIMPCKGQDLGLADNLNAAKKQSYKNYNLVTVVHTNNDVALEAIGATKTKFILSGFKCAACSGKVKSLSTAVSKFKDYDVYVILDSDVLIAKNWLANLIAPLADKGIGISTAYPEFVATGGFWSKVKHVWGFVGNGMMEREKTRFGWGGSLAFRKELLAGKNMSYFSNSISDDIALTKLARKMNLKIAYVPEANPIVRTNDIFPQFAEWSNRQTALSIAGDKKLFYYGIILYPARILVLFSAIALALLVNPLFAVLLLPEVLIAIRLYMRSKSHPYILAISPLMSFVYLYNMLKAKRMKTIKWRGNVYDITQIGKSIVP